MPLPVAAWIIYLCLPVSVHPNLVILPFAFVLEITAATYKRRDGDLRFFQTPGSWMLSSE
jgi:hypothetical protein